MELTLKWSKEKGNLLSQMPFPIEAEAEPTAVSLLRKTEKDRIQR